MAEKNGSSKKTNGNGQKMYEVKVPEIWYQKHVVMAKNKEEAIKAVCGGKSQLIERDDEDYLKDLPQKQWEVSEVQKPQEKKADG